MLPARSSLRVSVACSGASGVLWLSPSFPAGSTSRCPGALPARTKARGLCAGSTSSPKVNRGTGAGAPGPPGVRLWKGL